MIRTSKLILLLTAVIALSACSMEEREDPLFDEEVKTELLDKSELPQWLADYLDFKEYVPEEFEIPDNTRYGVYRFQWKGKTYYEFYDSALKMVHNQVYASDGTPIQLTKEDMVSLSEDVRDWTIVYLCHFSHYKPQSREFPISGGSYGIIDPFTYSQIAFRPDYSGFVFERQETIDCYAINSWNEIGCLAKGSVTLPTIDFYASTLIVGQVPAPQNSELMWQEIRTEDGSPTLYLYFETKLPLGSQLSDEKSSYYFWLVYPKLDSLIMPVKIVYNSLPDRYALGRTKVLSDARFPTEFAYADDGSLIVKGLQPVSDADFQQYSVGRGWEPDKLYQIQFDGSLFSGRMMGWPAYMFEFGDTGVTTYASDGSLPASYHFKTSWYYDESDNQLFFNNKPFLKLLSITEKRMAFVKSGGWMGDGKGNMREVFFLLIYKPMFESRLKEVREIFWESVSDLYREMTKEDICHKWILRNYSRLHSGRWRNYYQMTDRSDDTYHIQFLPDGSYRGKDTTEKTILGTYVYNGKDSLLLTPADGTTFPTFFYKLQSVSIVSLERAAYLHFYPYDSKSLTFVRGIEE
jgi:hypothetical protein